MFWSTELTGLTIVKNAFYIKLCHCIIIEKTENTLGWVGLSWRLMAQSTLLKVESSRSVYLTTFLPGGHRLLCG